MPLKIYRRPGGKVWHYRGTVAGFRLRGSTRTTDKGVALQIASQREADAHKHSLFGPASVLTFAQAVALYRSARKPERFILPVLDHWKETPVRLITPGAIRASCRELYPNGSAATWNRAVITPTQAIINHAAGEERCPPIKVRRFPIVKREKQPVTWTWVEAFMSASPPHLGALACFMFLTGARISEALSVKWSSVDLGLRRCKIHQSKTGTERWAHLPPHLVMALSNLPGGRSGSVFPFSGRTPAWSAWKKAVEAAGLKYLSPHACRHGFATSLLHAGIDPVTVAELGGWKSARLVMETYGHAMRDKTVTDRLVDTKIDTRKRKYR